MVLVNNLKVLKGTLMFLLFSVLFSCEDIGKYFVNCAECSQDEPQQASLKIKLDTGYGQITVNVFEGYLEDSLLFSTYVTSSKDVQISVPVNETFTLTAKYHINNRDYYTVNSVTPRVEYEKDQCDNPCYYVYDKVVDLRLKYTK